MTRLLVEARTAEWTSGDVDRELLVGVSASRADDGSPVTGLGVGNFRVAAQFGDLSDFAVDEVREWSWEPDNHSLPRVVDQGQTIVEVISTGT
jgi:hypothetical protein